MPPASSNPVQQAQQSRINQAIASLPPDVRAAVVAAGLQDARQVLPVPYWSTVRIGGTVASDTLTVDTSSRKAFQYAIGQNMQIAGFDSSFGVAQPCETNLLRAGETLDNGDVWIFGLAIELCTNSEPVLAAQVWRNSLVELSLNGTSSIRLGTLSMFPGAGGLYGAGQSALAIPTIEVNGPGINGGPGTPFAFAANGNPMAGNYRKFPQPFKWCGVGSGESDAQLSIIITPERPISIGLAASRAASTGVGPWSQPATGEPGTYVDLRVTLQSVSVARRSQNF